MNELENLRLENQHLRSQNALLREENECLRVENAALKAQVKNLERVVEELSEKITDLERRLNMNSSNSSKPPSSDGLKKKTAPALPRTKSGRKPVGQAGGKGTTLKQVSNPDKVEYHRLSMCNSCSRDLSLQSNKKIIKRQVFDIVIKQEVVEHQIETTTCDGCSTKNIAPCPRGIQSAVQYGTQIKGLVSYLSCFHLVPIDRLSNIVQHLTGFSLSPGSVYNICQELGECSKSLHERLGNIVHSDKVKNCDESGVRIAGKTAWLQVIATPYLTYYTVEEKRGSVSEHTAGISVHDRFAPYFKQDKIQHALCGAHLLRDLKSVIENDNEVWARAMHNLLRIVCHYSKKGVSPPQKLINKIKMLYQKIVVAGITYHENLKPLSQRKKRGKVRRRRGHNLAVALQKYQQEILLCLNDVDVPFTNNFAEQAVRMFKVQQKISGCFRTWQGALTFCQTRSVLATLQKQGRNVFQSIVLLFKGIFAQQLVEVPE